MTSAIGCAPRIGLAPTDRHGRRGRDQRVASEREALLVFAALDVVRDALHVVEAVVGEPGAAHAHELAGFQHAAVAQDVQAAGGRDRIRSTRRPPPARSARLDGVELRGVLLDRASGDELDVRGRAASRRAAAAGR